MVGSFSRVFDKISSEYGWSDKKIKKLTIRRMRQISAAIDERKWMEAFASRQLIAWQTRMLCSWMVKLTPDMTQEMATKLLEEASNISLDGVDKEDDEIATPKKTKISTGIPSRDDFYGMSDDEIESYLGKAENREGSFEAFRNGFARSMSRPN